MKNVQQAVLVITYRAFWQGERDVKDRRVQMDELLALVAGAERVGRPESR